MCQKIKSKKTLSKEEEINHICESFIKSNYSMSATGTRDVGQEELEGIFRVLFSNRDILSGLNELYSNHPDTIKLNRADQQYNCDDFNDKCNCFLPDITPENFTCRINRRKCLEASDRRNYPEYQEWRLSVFERDNHVCQKCLRRGGELNAHHIKSYKDFPELRLCLNNGTTLCKQCHKEAH